MKKCFIYGAIIVALGLISVAHFLVYQAIAVIFAPQPGIVPILQIATIILSLTFIIASVLTAKWNNLFTRIFYRISAVWLGFMLYFLLATGIFFLTFFLKVNFETDLLFGRTLFLIAVIAGIYALIHAGRTKVTRGKVRIANLPSSWKGRKVAFISDLHLGQVRGEWFAAKIAGMTLALKPDLVLIGGDLYDGVACDEKNIIQPLRSLASRASVPLGTYFVTGNHEEFRQNSSYVEAVRSAGIGVLNNEKVAIEGVQIIGVDYETTRKKADFEKVLHGLAIDKSTPSILLKHEPSNLDVAAQAGIKLQLSGHTHQAQTFPFNFLTRWIYGEFDYGLHDYILSDPDSSAGSPMRVLTSSGAGTWGPPLRLGTCSEVVLIEFA